MPSSQDRRQVARRSTLEQRIDEVARRENEMATLGEQIEVAVRTRDAAVARTECRAGELLTKLTREHSLSMEAALIWCGDVVTRAEGLRLRREHEAHS